jgi:biopolymer transport protein ExbD
MRRFSQRSHLVTLSEINITPLLDLAFVLLIIFVITTPLLEQSINVKLPKGMGEPDKPISKSDIRTVEVNLQGKYALDKRAMALDDVIKALVAANAGNPNTVVYIRADENGPYKFVAAVMDRCQRANLTRVSLRTEPQSTR